MDLTDAQRRAVEHDGCNLQLIACAGSGKTEVVARRVVHLLTPERPGSLEPRNIVAFTFTEKAAAELKERIVTRTREALGEIHGMADLFVGTIHAFCLDLLRAEAPEYLKYEVLNEVQQALFVDRHSRKSGLTTSTDLQGRRLKRYVDTNHYVNALATAVPRRECVHRGVAGQPVRQPRRDTHHDGPPGEGDGVACGLRAGASQEPLPRTESRRPDRLAPHSERRRDGATALRGDHGGRAPALLSGTTCSSRSTGVANFVFSFSDRKYFFACRRPRTGHRRTGRRLRRRAPPRRNGSARSLCVHGPPADARGVGRATGRRRRSHATAAGDTRA